MNRVEGKTVLIINAAHGQKSCHALGFAAEGTHIDKLDVSVALERDFAVERTEHGFGPTVIRVSNVGS